MVKSFQGVRQANTIIPEKITVGDFMTKRLITFSPDQSINEVAEVLVKNNITGGPVVDKENHLIGMISEGDCLKELAKGIYSNTPIFSSKVSDYMVKEVKTIHPDMNILEAAKMFLNLRLRRFPVIKDGKLVGQISQRDVLKALQKF
jgi:CBS domain-containing protein